METQPLMSVTELAAKLNVSTDTVYRNIASRKWEATKIGRIYRFTEDHYQAIIAPPVVVEQKPRTQRRNIERLLRSI